MKAYEKLLGTLPETDLEGYNQPDPVESHCFTLDGTEVREDAGNDNAE